MITYDHVWPPQQPPSPVTDTVVLVEDGLIRSLEGYTYDEPWPTELRDVALYYVSGGRAAVRSALGL
jgi:hypothetical protein